jgi:Na+/H+-dicarboxylate symporter
MKLAGKALRAPLWAQVTVALFLGALAGAFLGNWTPYWSWLGSLFLTLIKMLVLPLIFVSLVGGVASLGDVQRLGRIGLKTFSLYFLTTAIAIPIGLAVAIMMAPGEGVSLAELVANPVAPAQTTASPSLIPDNAFAAFAQGNTLQVIVFSLLLGLGACVAGEKSQPFVALVESFGSVVFTLTDIVIRMAPLGVFALTSAATAEHGATVLLPLLKLVLCLYLGCGLHLALGLPLLIKLFTGLSPIQFYRGILEAQVVAFSATTAAGPLPVTMACAEQNLGVSRQISAFVLPVGATVNMDGTALYQALAAVFIAQVYGVDLAFADYLGIATITFVASIGTAAIPAAGLVVLSMVLSSAGLPLEGLALVAGVDRVLDMARTATNVSGDSAVALIVARSENQLDREVFDAPAA